MTDPSSLQPAVMSGDLHQRDAWRAELSRELTFQASLEGTIAETNGMFADVLGWSGAELRTTNFMDLVHPDDVRKTREEWRRVVEGAAPSRFSVQHRRKDGSCRWVSWSAVARDNTVCAVGRDTTVEVETLQALQRADSIVRLGAGLRHELNNLFQTIVAALQLVQRLIHTGRIAETEQFIESAMRAGRDAAAINQRLATLSRPTEPSSTPFAMNELVADVVDLMRRSLSHSFELVTTLGPNLWSVRCDRQQAQLAVLNLIINACDALSDAGTIVVTTSNQDATDTDVSGRASGQFIAIEVTGSRTLSDANTQGSRDPYDIVTSSAPTLERSLLMARCFALQNGGGLTAEIREGHTVVMVLYLPRENVVGARAQTDTAIDADLAGRAP